MTEREPSIIDWSPGGTVWRANLDAAYPWREGKSSWREEDEDD